MIDRAASILRSRFPDITGQQREQEAAAVDKYTPLSVNPSKEPGHISGFGAGYPNHGIGPGQPRVDKWEERSDPVGFEPEELSAQALQHVGQEPFQVNLLAALLK